MSYNSHGKRKLFSKCSGQSLIASKMIEVGIVKEFLWKFYEVDKTDLGMPNNSQLPYIHKAQHD